MNNLLRTTSFRLPPSSFGQVFTYRAGDRFRTAWQAVEDSKGLTAEKRLPYSSACTALQVLTGDFVAMYPRAGAGNDNLVFVSRKELSRDTLESVFIAWEYAMLPNATGALAEAIDDLHQERKAVGDFIEHRKEQCPKAPGWVWDAAKWELAHRLATRRWFSMTELPRRCESTQKRAFSLGTPL
jgi:pPIWI_RE module N-terminal domain